MEARFYFIGVDGEQVVDSTETQRQINEVKALVCGLEHEGRPLDWSIFDNPDEPRTLFQAIRRDRELRVDQHTFMADRPSFVVVTAIDNKAVRMEFYEGHDSLSLVHDLRAKELHGVELPQILEEDPEAYDPSEFLSKHFGIPVEFTKPILEHLHDE